MARRACDGLFRGWPMAGWFGFTACRPVPNRSSSPGSSVNLLVVPQACVSSVCGGEVLALPHEG